MLIWIILAVAVIILFIGLRGYMLFLSGEKLSKYDTLSEPTYETDPNSPGLQSVNEYLVENFIKPAQAPKSKQSSLEAKRARFEKGGLARTDLKADYKDDIAVIDGEEVPGAWTLVKGADPKKRLLYLHGGGYTVGSAVSHRAMTVNMAKRTGAVIFAPNYRLMPENHRLACYHDCQIAYQWILENGPNGPEDLNAFAVAGDSAGANATLSLLPWARDEGLRQANAAIGISAPTDSTFSSPSIRTNFDKDLMLKPLVAPLLKPPRWLLLIMIKKLYGVAPTDPRVSPIHANLSELPPVLLQSSYDEMLFDDAARYAEKMRQAGGDIALQSWDNMPHVFQIFDRDLPEAHQAHDLMAEFLKAYNF